MQANETGIQLVHHKDIIPLSDQFHATNQTEGEEQQQQQNNQDGKDIAEAVDTDDLDSSTTQDTNAMFTEEVKENSDVSSSKCSDKVKKGTEIKLPKFYISDEIGTVCMNIAMVQVICGRCHTKSDFKVKTNQ